MPVGRAHRPSVPDKTAVMPAGPSVQDKTAVMPAGPFVAKREALDFSKNRKIGHFELIRELARGGMGQVFVARDTKLGRKVAIKFLLYSDVDLVQRFIVEAKATARCTHENIVTIFEVGEHEGLPYMVLEYLQGTTFSDVLDRKPSQRQVVEIMIAVTRALERAHEFGIVHRDLKPSNVFVTDRGGVKVLDFGVARVGKSIGAERRPPSSADSIEIRPDDAGVTFTSNSLIGTFPYMSPEQWGADVVDHQADLWAVGIMLWRGLAPGHPHPAGPMTTDGLRAELCNLDTPLASIGTREPGLPAELVRIVDRCLAKRKSQRYQTASELLADLQAFLAPSADRPAGDACPYRGLAAFGEDDAKYFFGRTNEIRTALAQLANWPLLAVIGPSGVGKSSFVHAGLAPALRSSGGNWQVRVLRPGRLPLHRLAAVLEESLATGEHADHLLGQLRDSPGVFGSMLRAAAARRNQQVLVVVDQLEELFTLCDSDAIRQVFLAALLAAADDPSSPVRVVLSMRADFLDRLAGHKYFLDELSRGLFFLTAPDRENLRETLMRPAELAGYTFEDPSIVEDMLDVATSRGALPLLSFAATRLWDARDAQRKLLTKAAYQQMGGVAGAFARHADQVAAAVPPTSQILLRTIMTRLVTPEGTRAIIDRKELLSLRGDKPAQQREIEQILDQLVRARLIHLHTDLDQTATVEIVHEMLISEWPMLRRWLDDSQGMRGFSHELAQAARQWEARGRPHDLLWRGATAEEAFGYRQRYVLDLSATETAFLDAVARHAVRTRQRKLLLWASTVAVLAMVIAGGSFFTVQLSHANRAAQAKAQEAETANEQAQNKATEAEAAKAALQQKLDVIEEKEQARKKAEAEAKQAQDAVIRADKDVALSREELERANAELRRSLAQTQAEKDRAQAAAEAARRATEEARAARAEALAAAAAERARADALEQESKAIYNKDLRKKKHAESGSAASPAAGSAASPAAGSATVEPPP